MQADHAASLLDLFRHQQIAALGTLHEGRPFVSMVPFAIRPDGAGLLIHVSQLASHTQDMIECPDVGLMVAGQPGPDRPALAVPRLSIQGDAQQLDKAGSDYAEGRAAYVARFPDSEQLFGFGDFSLFFIRPRSARFVGGFAAARTLSAATVTGVLAEAAGVPAQR